MKVGCGHGFVALDCMVRSCSALWVGMWMRNVLGKWLGAVFDEFLKNCLMEKEDL